MPLGLTDKGIALKITYKNEASAGIKNTEAELTGIGKAAQSAATKATGATHKLQTAAQRAASQLKNAYGIVGVRSMKDIKREIDRTNAAYNRLAKTGKLSAAEQRQAADATKAKIAGLKREIKGTDGMLVSVMKHAKGLLAVGGAVLGVAVLKSVAESGQQMQAIMSKLEFATGNAGKSMSFLRKESDLLGLDLERTAQGFGLFAAATKGTAIEGQITRDIMHGVALASTALHLSAEQTSGALNALQQMMSKGNVQAEELRGQLGERIPGAFKMAADAMGVTEKELNKMLATGKVLAIDMVPKLAKEFVKAFGGQAAKSAHNLTQEINRLNSAMFELKTSLFKAAIGDSMSVAIRGTASAVDLLANNVGVASGGLLLMGIRAAGSKVELLATATSTAAIIAKGPAFKALALSIATTAAPLAALAAGAYAINTIFDTLNKEQDSIAAAERDRFQTRLAAIKAFQQHKAELQKIGVDTASINTQDASAVVAALDKLATSEYHLKIAAAEAAAGQKKLNQTLGDGLTKATAPALAALDKLQKAMRSQAQKNIALRAKLFQATGGGAKGFFGDQVNALKGDIKSMLAAGIGQQDVAVYMRKQLDTMRQQATKAGALYQADSIDSLSRSAQTMVQTMANSLQQATGDSNKFTAQIDKTILAVTTLAGKLPGIMPAGKSQAITARLATITQGLKNMASSANISTNVEISASMNEIASIRAALDAIPRVVTTIHRIVSENMQAPALQSSARQSGSRATGGAIPRDGLYYMHAGEQVVSNNSQSFGNINIYPQGGMPGNKAEVRAFVRNILMPEIAAATR